MLEGERFFWWAAVFLLVAMVKNAEISFLSSLNFSYHAGIK